MWKSGADGATSKEAVEIVPTDDPDNPVKFFRVLTAKYAPGFAAALFTHPYIQSVTVRSLQIYDLRYFREWLQACWIIDEREQVEGRLPELD